jgi:hypothetical protein
VARPADFADRAAALALAVSLVPRVSLAPAAPAALPSPTALPAPAALPVPAAVPVPAALPAPAALRLLTVGEAAPFVAALVVARAARAAVPPAAAALPLDAGVAAPRAADGADAVDTAAGRGRADGVASAARPPEEVSLAPSRERGRVSQATAAPVAATGHSTTPARPSTPAPV